MFLKNLLSLIPKETLQAIALQLFSKFLENLSKQIPPGTTTPTVLAMTNGNDVEAAVNKTVEDLLA